jgi:hypothetical protein
LQLGNKIYVANLGDSTSFLSIILDEEVQVVYESQPDKPNSSRERERILQMGGQVHVSADDDNVSLAYQVDPETNMLRHGIPISRSIGDWQVPGVIAEPIVTVLEIEEIISSALASYSETCAASVQEAYDDDESEQMLPEVCPALGVEDVQILAVSATKGVTEFSEEEMQLDDIAHIFAASFFVEGNPHPHTASQFVLVEAAHWWDHFYRGDYRDDMAVAATKVWTWKSID